MSSLEDKVATLTAELSELKTVLEGRQEASEFAELDYGRKTRCSMAAARFKEQTAQQQAG